MATTETDAWAFESGELYKILLKTKAAVAAADAVLAAEGSPMPDPTTPIAPAITSLTSLVLGDGPVAYWDMQIGSAARTVTDKGTSGVPLQLQGTEWVTDAPDFRRSPYALGRIAKSSEWQGTSSTGQAATGSYMTATGRMSFTSGFTFEAWVSPKNWNWIQTIISARVSGAVKATIEHVKDTGFKVNGTTIGDVTLDPGLLHHLVITVTAAGAATLYWDGVQKGTATTAAWPTATDDVQIGKGQGTNTQMITSAWTHIALYGKALDAAAVKARWDAGNGNAPMPTKGIYNLQAVQPSKLFANQKRSLPFYGDDNRFRTATWWGSASSAAELIAEKDAGGQAMIVILGAEQPTWYQQAGMYALPVINPPSSRWQQVHMASPAMYSSDRVVAAVTEDEVSLAGTVDDALKILSADLDKVPADVASWTNHGFDIICWRPRDDMARILNAKGTTTGRQHQIQGGDYYTHSTDPRIRAEAGQKWGLLPTGDAAANEEALRRSGELRHCWASYENVRTLRAAYDHDVLHQAFIGLGHANAITGGMPTGREVRGDAWASIIGGAQAIAWFYHSFPNCPGWWNGGNFSRSSRLVYSYKGTDGVVRYYRPRVEKTTAGLTPLQAPAEWEQVSGMYLEWDASYAHQQDDTVIRSGKFWTAVGKPRLGVAPEADMYDDATDTGAWVTWDFQSQGLRSLAKSAAPGMTGWVKKVSAEADKLAPVVHTPAANLPLSDESLIWRYWPNTGRKVANGDSKPYAWVAVMQGYNQWSGTYTVTGLPTTISQVEVFTDLTAAPTTVPVSNGAAQISFAKEYDVRFLRWAI